ncbi:hypothetical protein DPSP01_000009 [Paraphaeosphaeria sporulosa]|uniref:Glyoxalase/fosfomycin resistance/dioxygenase domain-containing protein n=1 Tax=Paraphaeosphaeria sporulosa TaxID=1460663 RepID=A0A177D1R5_9PLEO|nr:uncharacterized protein CC84DRAFT_1212529 [Paraphaeosphaeria sporulosa]OAG13070.1 hypothetical protein CC84DRAFT_1212529 [Paraphaeosphaeria sporulosa]
MEMLSATLISVIAFTTLASADAIPRKVSNTTIPTSDTFTYPPTCTLSTSYPSLPYSMYHLSFVTPNLTRALHFYTHALGLTHIFTYKPIPRYYIAYLGQKT